MGDAQLIPQRGLGADLEQGLAQAEAEARLAHYGPNEVAEEKTNPWLSFGRRFWGLSAWMLELIIVLSLILRNYADLYVVTALLVVNAVLGFLQEQRAAGAIQALRRRLQVTARVLRDGHWRELPARELVPGDVIRLRAGDIVPADACIINGNLGLDQSALTGESLIVEQGANGEIYSGSLVRRGEANAIILRTGSKTYYGRTAELVSLARPKLHIEEIISQVVRWLFAIVGSLLAITLIYALAQGVNLREMLPLTLVLLLGAVPVALPAMFTVTMALGAIELARRGVLVTRLSASEDAASMDVLCVDKTGTLTENQLTIADVIPCSGFGRSDVLLYGVLASQEANHDPIDQAFVHALKAEGLRYDGYEQVEFIPFDPNTRQTEALVRRGQQSFRVVKGAVEVVASHCMVALPALQATLQENAARGHRILAVARGEGESLDLVGMVALADPPRPDARKLVQELKALGVAVKMLTGDALPIAREVARRVGLGESVSLAADLAIQEPAEAARLVEVSAGFAGIYPEGKYTVVQSLQARGHIVGMTGDGVNDAPSLRQAEVGIAVSNATDIAKGAASVVLTDEGLAGIVDLIRNGRRIDQRISVWILNKISRTVLKTGFVVLAYLFTGKLVVSALAMLAMMFMTDFVKISLATDNVRGSQYPHRWNVGRLVQIAIVLGLLMVAEALIVLWVGLRFWNLGDAGQALHTYVFETLLYFALLSLLVMRERRHFWASMPGRTLLIALGGDAVVATIMGTVGVPGLPSLPITATLANLGLCTFFSLVVNDLIKCALVRGLNLSW